MPAPEEYRFTKIDDAIQRLAQVANDLSKILAVHEQRIIQQEKTADNITDLVEKRREELEEKIKTIYETIKKEDTLIFSETKKLGEKISSIEKMIWIATGAGSVVGYLISVGINYLKR